MKPGVADARNTFEELHILARLDAFDPSEIRESVDFHGSDINERIDVTVTEASRLLRTAKIQLEHEEFTHLEYSVYRLRSIFLTIGCHRLAFLFERIFRNLSKIRIDYLRELFGVVSEEFVAATRAIKDFLGGSHFGCRLSEVQ